MVTININSPSTQVLKKYWLCFNLLHKSVPYIVDSVDERVDTAVAHGQDMAAHPHVVYTSEAGTCEFVSVLHIQRCGRHSY